MPTDRLEIYRKYPVKLTGKQKKERAKAVYAEIVRKTWGK